MDMGTVGIVIGVSGIVIGLVSSYFFYYRGAKSRRPVWAIRSNNLVRDYSSTDEKMTILYRDQAVPNVTVSKILIWNEGKETIDRNDIVEANPLSLRAANGVRILDAKVLAAVRGSVAFDVELADNGQSVDVSFDYLDHMNGAVIQVVHDGTSSSDIQLVGDIKGVPRIRSKAMRPAWMRKVLYPIRLMTSSRRGMANAMILTSIIYIVFPLGTLLLPLIDPRLAEAASATQRSVSRIVPSVVIALAGLFLLVLSISLRRSYSIAPPGLEVFYD